MFATPEIGAVGLTEAEARARYESSTSIAPTFRPMKATLSGRREHTIMKLVVEAPPIGCIGAHILGHEAGEMIQLLAIAIKMKATKADLDATMAVHPTAAEELVTMRTPHSPATRASRRPEAPRVQAPSSNACAISRARPPT